MNMQVDFCSNMPFGRYETSGRKDDTRKLDDNLLKLQSDLRTKFSPGQMRELDETINSGFDSYDVADAYAALGSVKSEIVSDFIKLRDKAAASAYPNSAIDNSDDEFALYAD